MIGPAYISRETLLAALENLFRTYGVTSVGALDATALHYDELGTVGVGYTEYWDHHYSAMFALDAALRIGSGISVELFRGYTLTRIEPNVAASDACKKLDAFAQYAVFDSTIVEQPTPSDYWSCPDCYLSGGYQLYSSQSWQRRESATWSVAATGLLVNETGLTLDDNGEYLLFDNGQLRARDALCVTAVDTRFENLECQPQAGSDGHVTDRPPAEQTWAVYAK